jgi:hypothetical protein
MKKVILGLLVVGGLGLGIYGIVEHRNNVMKREAERADAWIKDFNEKLDQGLYETDNNTKVEPHTEVTYEEPNVEVTYESNNSEEEALRDLEGLMSGDPMAALKILGEARARSEEREIEENRGKILMNCSRCHGTGINRDGDDCGRCRGRGQVLERP